MATTRHRRCFDHMVFVSSLLVSVAACSGSGSTANEPDGGLGGNTGVAGASGPGGNSGAAGASGGSSALAGATAGSGGSANLGGTSTGGKSAVAGTTATGGKSGTAGTTGSGGTTALGGSTGTAGKTSTGGSATGGNTSAGGTTGTGGKSATGGTSGGTGGGAGGGTGGGTGGGAGGSTGSAGDYGFTFRPVGDKQLDFLCTLKTVGESTYVYARMDQTGTKSVGIATIPVYTVALAKISISGAVSDLANPRYDYGSGHNIDSLRFDYQGKTYEYYHSSLGFGYRPCQPMDCINIYAPGGTTPTTEGCTSARTLPEVCVPIKADGTHDALKDTFKKCPGSTN